MNFTEEQKHEAIEFGKFYINLMENHLDQVDLYLADNVVLDWFGRTIKGRKNVFSYISSIKSTITHKLNPAVPSKFVGFKDVHNVNNVKKDTNEILAVPLDKARDIYNTPPNSIPSSSRIREQGQGDGPHNNVLISPPENNIKLGLASDIPDDDLKYVSLTGAIEFQRGSRKKLQKTNKWDRPCRVEIGYTSTKFQDCQIYLMVYAANMPCRRNLMADFMQYSDKSKSKDEKE